MHVGTWMHTPQHAVEVKEQLYAVDCLRPLCGLQGSDPGCQADEAGSFTCSAILTVLFDIL